MMISSPTPTGSTVTNRYRAIAKILVSSHISKHNKTFSHPTGIRIGFPCSGSEMDVLWTGIIHISPSVPTSYQRKANWKAKSLRQGLKIVCKPELCVSASNTRRTP